MGTTGVHNQVKCKQFTTSHIHLVSSSRFQKTDTFVNCCTEFFFSKYELHIRIYTQKFKEECDIFYC